MKCKCGYPIPPQNSMIIEGFFIFKEVSNIIEWECKKCGRRYTLKSYKGNIEAL